MACSGPIDKISLESVHNFLSNVAYRQTGRNSNRKKDRQTNRQTNATENTTSLGREEIDIYTNARIYAKSL